MFRGPRGPYPGRALYIGQRHSAVWPSSVPVGSSEAAGTAAVILAAPPCAPSCAGIATFSTRGAASAAATTLAWGRRISGPGPAVAGRCAATAGLATGGGAVLGPPAELFVIEAEDMGAGVALARRSGGTSDPATAGDTIPPPPFAADGRFDIGDVAAPA